MLIREIAQYLDSLNLLTYEPESTTGDTFLGFIPPKPDSAVAITQYPGSNSPGYGEYDSPRVQVRVRDTSAVRAQGRAQEVYDNLHGFHDGEFTAGGASILNCLGVGSGPVPMGPDENGRFEYACNFETTYLNTNRSHRK